MKTTILGAGAMGSILAGYLARSGEDVSLIARGERLKYLKDNGITITGLDNFNVACELIDDPKSISETDALILTVKTYDMESALNIVSHIKASCVFSVQNGVMKDEQLASLFGKKNTLGAAAYLSGEVFPDGPVNFTINNCLYLGELPEGKSSRVNEIVEIFKKAGINSEVAPQIQNIEWTKFCDWICLMPLAVLTRFESYKIYSDPNSVRIGLKILKEIASLISKMNITLVDLSPVPLSNLNKLSDEEFIKNVCEFGEVMKAVAPNHRISALQDLERGRRLEVEETLGYVITKAGEQNVPVPTLETCYLLCATINNFID
jgi:2-dehydropantoate 2-reductase